VKLKIVNYENSRDKKSGVDNTAEKL